MKTLTIKIDLGNAAFADRGASEVARILNDLAKAFEDCGIVAFKSPIRDINGNTVGAVTVR